MTNCPNCGAPKTGPVCEYCGTMLEDPGRVLQMALGKTVSIGFEAYGRLYEFDMVLEDADIRAESNSTGFYADDRLVRIICRPEFTASFSGRLVPARRHGRECLYAVRDMFPEEMTI